MQRSSILIASLSTILAGCASKSMPTEPMPVLTESLPQQFTAKTTQNSHSEANRSEMATEWWASFNDPQLESLISQALSNNFSFQAAINRLQQSAAKATQAGANSSLTLDATFDADRTMQSSDSTSTFQFGVMASYEIDLWSRLSATKQAAEFDYLASQQELDVIAITLSSEIALNWYQAVTLNGLIELYSQQLTVLDKQLEMLTLHHQYGQNNIEDIWQQQQLQRAQQAKLLTAQSELKVIEQQIKVLTGDLSFTLKDLPPLSRLPLMPNIGVPAQLLNQRPDLKQAWFAVQSQQQNVVVAEADRYPQIQITASLLSNSNNISNLMSDWVSQLAGSILVPIIDGGARTAVIEEQQAVLNESLNNYTQKVIQVVSEVETALTQEQSEHVQLNNIEQRLALASKTAQIKQLRYQNGSVDFLQVLIAQQSQLDLQQSQVESQGNLFALRIALHRSIAGNLNTFEPNPADNQTTQSVAQDMD
ncbi:outer membrane efflux protein [Vibrio inusitatus NBRC 102082]|uniref:Outer membrane efflux protein n=2 Tax=Vibrio inusitatus TaxID=413402 RepID=A0A4Y3HRA6_9VIBR|nr:outer membrane efflux protein [Vibrio inusitatus NBRC 102082]